MSKAQKRLTVQKAIENGWTYSGIMSGLYQAEYGLTKDEMTGFRQRYANEKHYVFKKKDKEKRHPISFTRMYAGTTKKLRNRAIADIGGKIEGASMEQAFFNAYCKRYSEKNGKELAVVYEED